jgi:hypothetical protein
MRCRISIAGVGVGVAHVPETKLAMPGEHFMYPRPRRPCFLPIRLLSERTSTRSNLQTELPVGMQTNAVSPIICCRSERGRRSKGWIVYGRAFEIAFADEKIRMRATRANRINGKRTKAQCDPPLAPFTSR